MGLKALVASSCEAGKGALGTEEMSTGGWLQDQCTPTVYLQNLPTSGLGSFSLVDSAHRKPLSLAFLLCPRGAHLSLSS